MKKTRTKKAVEEMKGQLRMILEAADGPLTFEEVRDHPTMKGRAGQGVAQALRFMSDVKNVRDKWVLIKKAKKVKNIIPEEYSPAAKISNNATFLLKKNGDLCLKVAGVVLPVEFEL